MERAEALAGQSTRAHAVSKPGWRRVVLYALGLFSVLLSLPGFVAVELSPIGWLALSEAASEISAQGWWRHSLLEWSATGLALLLALFVAVEGRTSDRGIPSPLALSLAFLMAGLADGFHTLSAWPPGPGSPGAAQASLLSWTVGRWLLALGCLAALALPASGPRRRNLATGGVVSLGLVMIGLLSVGALLGFPEILVRSLVLPRPFDLPPLLAFALVGLWAVPRLRPLRESLFGRAIVVATIPWVLGQVEAAFGSIQPFDLHFHAAHAQKVLAYVILLLGLVLETRKVGMAVVAAADNQAKAALGGAVPRPWESGEAGRQHAETTLRVLETAVETMSMGVTVTDLEGKILYVNPADAAIHGYEVPELLGKNARMFAPVGTPSNSERAPDGREPWSRERVNVTKDGREFPARLVSDVVRDGRGQPIAMVTLCEDISERRGIRAALERRERILEAVGFAAEKFLAGSSWEEKVGEVLESLGKATGTDRVYLSRLEGPEAIPTFHMNKSWLAPDGSFEDSRTMLPRLPPRGALFDRWKKRLREGEILQGRVQDLPEEERVVLEVRGVRSLAVVPIFVQSSWRGFLSLEDHKVNRTWSAAELEALRTAARTFGAAVQRKEAEEALAASEAKVRDLLENANDLIQSVTPDGRFEFVNRMWGEALGYAPEEVAELTLWDVVHPQHLRRFRDVVEGILAGEELGRVEVSFLRRDGTEISLEGSLNRRLEEGRPAAVRGIFRDITERRMLDRIKQEFISTVSHELRTPLTSIIASLGLLDSGRLAGKAESVRELVTVAHRNSRRLLELINDLLDLQKLSAGKMSLSLETVEIVPLLEEAVRGIAAYAESFKVGIDLEATDGLRAYGDRGRLIQVLNNLLSNAIKFSAAGERVTLRAGREGGWVRIAVEDRGEGIPAEFQERLFEKFTQVDSSATRRSGGSGLGLSIVKGLVEQMQGKVALESELGKGSTFYVYLPDLAAGDESVIK